MLDKTRGLIGEVLKTNDAEKAKPLMELAADCETRNFNLESKYMELSHFVRQNDLVLQDLIAKQGEIGVLQDLDIAEMNRSNFDWVAWVKDRDYIRAGPMTRYESVLAKEGILYDPMTRYVRGGPQTEE